MPELIFIIIISIFIGGMLWSDRDSRRWRFGEPFPPYSAAREALKALREYEESDGMLLYRSAIVQAQFNAFIESNQVAVLPPVIFTESKDQ